MMMQQRRRGGDKEGKKITHKYKRYEKRKKEKIKRGAKKKNTRTYTKKIYLYFFLIY